MSTGGMLRWHYSGYIPIPRSTPDGMVETRIPFQFSISRAIQLNQQEAIARAGQVAQQFLQLMQDTAPARRDDYGQPQQPVFQFVGFLPGTVGPPPGAQGGVPDWLNAPIPQGGDE